MRLKDELERVMRDREGRAIEGLRAVYISAMPDGLFVWGWSDGQRLLRGGELAALVQHVCHDLAEFGAEAPTLRMFVETDDLSIHCMPLCGPLMVHVVFAGSRLPGEVRVEAQRLCERLRARVADARLLEDDPVRDRMIDRLLIECPEQLLLGLREQHGFCLAELEWPESLTPERRAILSAALD